MVDAADVDKLIQDTDYKCAVRAIGHRDRYGKYKKLHKQLGLPVVICAALAGALQSASFPIDDDGARIWVTGIAVVLTWLVAIGNATITFLNPQETSQNHRDKVAKYTVLMSKMARARANKSGQDLKAEIDSMVAEFEDLQGLDPMLDPDAMTKATTQVARTPRAPIES